MRQNKHVSLSTAAVAAVLVLAGCSGGADDATVGVEPDSAGQDIELYTSTPAGVTEVDHVDWGVMGPEPSSLDPIRIGSDQDFITMSNMCESLFRVDENFGFGPGLAEEGEWTDEHTYVLTLRDDVTFWNGDPMTSEDVVVSLERHVDPENGSIYINAFEHVSSIEASGDYEVTVTFSTPDAEFPNSMASAPGIVVQADYIEESGGSLGTPDGGVMCTGPYQLDAWNTGSTIEMSANEGYWDGAPLTKELELHYIDDESTLSNALVGSQIDGAFFVPIASADQLDNAENGELVLGPSTASMGIGPAVNEGPAADPRFREAIAAAIDQEQFIDTVLGGMGYPIRTFTVPFQWDALEAADIYRQGYEELPEPVQDLERAKELLADIDYEGQTFSIAVPSGNDTYTRAATVVQATGEELGIDFEINQMPGAQYAELFYNPEARAEIDFIVTTGYSTTPGVLEYPQQFVTEQGLFNWSDYRNEEAEELIFEARGTTDPQESAEQFIASQSLFGRDYLQISLGGEYSRTFVSNELTGVITSSANFVTPWALNLGGVAE